MKTNILNLKKILVKSSMILMLVVFCSFSGDKTNLCDEAIQSATKALDPYNYDSAEATYIKCKTEKQEIKDIEVILYFGERYRFVFNTENAPDGLKIEVYDRKSKSSSRNLLFSNVGKQGKVHYFEPAKSRTMYINYTVPATVQPKDTLKSGCVVFALGYEIKKLF